MPLYEYTCNDCGHTWEEVNSIVERWMPTTEPCPKCGKEEVVKNGACINLFHGVVNPSKKMDSNFKEEMNRIKSEHPNGFKNSTYF
jgi:putative FmdB family regulatory protein